jgi:hypothetical protein
MCPLCNNKLTPIIYTRIVDDRYMQMHKEGLILLAGEANRYGDAPKSYCTKCQEPFDRLVPIDNMA